MKFLDTALAGVCIVELERREDERGFFARAWCREEFARRGLSTEIVQINTAYSHRQGTLRGMHFQRAPHAEVKLVHCPRGAVYDVAVDLRPDSPTCKRWVGVELDEHNFRALYIPEGCAHGYLTLRDETVVTYLTSYSYVPQAAGGVRYDDPAFAIEWPQNARVVSAQDRAWPDFTAMQAS